MNSVGRAISEVIRAQRAQRGWTQEQLAEKAGIAPTSIVRLENAEINRPRWTTLDKIERAFPLSSGDLTAFLLKNPPEHPEHVEAADIGTFTAVYVEDEGWWIGYVEELPGANAQEKTLKEVRKSLKEAVADVLEANRELTRTEFGERAVVRESISV